jgi:hypothetical protein
LAGKSGFRSDIYLVSNLYRRAESILKVASVSGAGEAETALVLDRAGHLRVLNSEGWSLPGLIREYGAAEVFLIKKWAGRTTVESWSQTDRCVLHSNN